MFGVKQSSVVSLDKVDKATAEQYDIRECSWLLNQDFLLVTEDEASRLRYDSAVDAMKKLGLRMKMVDYVPVPELN